MRRACRVAVAVLLAYHLQASVLPYLKIGGNVLDLVTVTLFSIGYACGLYAGLMAGGLAALVMEVSAGDLQGLIAVVCVAAGGLGAWSSGKIRGFRQPGKRKRELRLRQFAPMVLITLYVAGKELLYALYFYIIGMEVGAPQIFKAIGAGVYAGVVSLLLLPLIYNFLVRRPEETMLARWLAKRRARGDAKRLKNADKGIPAPVEGGTGDA